MDRFEALLLRWEDGRATAEEQAEWVGLLQRPEARKRLVESFFITYGIQDALREAHGQSGIVEQEPLERTADAERGKSKKRRSALSRTVQRPKANPGIRWAVAAGVLLAMGIGLHFLPSRSRQDSRSRGAVESARRRPAVEVTERPPLPPRKSASIAPRRGRNPPAPGPRTPPRESRGRHALGKVRVGSRSPRAETIARSPSGSTDVVSLTEPPREKVKQSPVPHGVTDGPAKPTQGPVAHIARVDGLVMYARGPQGRWVKAVQGIALLAGDRLETRAGMAALTLVAEPGGAASTKIYANRHTVLRLVRARTAAGDVLLADLARGEIYVEDGGRQVHVETPDGLVAPVGTRFDVLRRPSFTLVTVEHGAVEVRVKDRKSTGSRAASKDAAPRTRDGSRVDLRALSWKGKALRLRAGDQARLRRGAPLAAPAQVDLGRILAWARRFRGETMMAQVEFHDDFEDGVLDPRWRTSGEVGAMEQDGQVRIHVTHAGTAWMGGRVYSARAFSVSKSVSFRIDVWQDGLTPHLRTAVSLAAAYAAGHPVNPLIRYWSVGGDERLEVRASPASRKHGRVLWQSKGSFTAERGRTVELMTDRRHVTLTLDGQRVYHGPHGLVGFTRVVPGMEVYSRLGKGHIREGRFDNASVRGVPTK